jgi:H+/Cl- antiporter ClcA
MSIQQTPARASASSLMRLGGATLLTGLGAGLIGLLLTVLMHAIQHLAYGYGSPNLIGSESFLQGVSAAAPLRRVLALLCGGLLAGAGWGAAGRYLPARVSLAGALRPPGRRMPLLGTWVHGLLQIATVALGSPLGREGAPREIAAACSGWLCRQLRLSARHSRILIACGAGAGLAAVYNVPLGGTLFTLEVLLSSFSLEAALPALTSSAIAALLVWYGLGDQTPYQVPHFSISPSLLSWALLSGPLFGLSGHGYARLAARARARAPRGWRLLAGCLLVFLLIGLCAIPFPQLPGNGKGPAQLGFGGNLGLTLATSLLLLKTLATLACLRAGAEGGLLTPAVSLGALLAIVIGGLWNLVWPGTPLGAFAMIGAAAFLASSSNMPLTALALLFEFTHAAPDFLIPLACAVGGAMLVVRRCAPASNGSAED